MTSHFQNPGEAHGEGTVKAVKATDSAAGLSQNLSEICGKQSLEFCSKSRSGCLATKGRQKTLSIESIGCPSVVFTVAIRGLYPSQGGPRSQDWLFRLFTNAAVCSSARILLENPRPLTLKARPGHSHHSVGVEKIRWLTDFRGIVT